MTRKRKKGNRLSSLTDDAGAVTLQGAADVAPYAGTGAFSYDSRGRLTRDMTRGITRITYNHLGLPVTVTLSNGNSALFTYSGEGEKLRALYTATDMALFGQGATPVAVLVTTRVDYRPGRVYVGGGLAYAQVPGGYCTVSADTLSAHMTVSDYRGDVRSVIAEDGRVEERNDYYPYGMAFYSPAASVQPWKHSGKEHESRLGIHWLDFGARRLDFAKGQWTTVDPLCEKTPWQSPYAYCGADPVNKIDPDGKQVKPDSLAFQIILNTLSHEEQKYVILYNNGYIDSDRLSQCKSQSNNYLALWTLVDSPIQIDVTTLSKTKYIENGTEKVESFEPVVLLDDFRDYGFSSSTGNTTGESGNLGVTYMPTKGGKGKGAINANSIHININPSLSLVGAAETFSHEGYGHALIYIRTNGDRNKAKHHIRPGWIETNQLLIDYSIRARKETIMNLKR